MITVAIAVRLGEALIEILADLIIVIKVLGIENGAEVRDTGKNHAHNRYEGGGGGGRTGVTVIISCLWMIIICIYRLYSMHWHAGTLNVSSKLRQ